MDFTSAFSQAFNTFQNKGRDFINNLGGGINQVGQTVRGLPQQFQAGYELAKPAIYPLTVPARQVSAGVGQRMNNPWIASPVSQIERAILGREQRLKESGVLEPGSDFYENKIAKRYQPTLEERFDESFYRPTQEKTSSAEVPGYARPRLVSTTPVLSQIRDQALGIFTPTARSQLSAIPFGVEPPMSYAAGTAAGPVPAKSITFQEDQVGGPYERHIAVHELLHTVARGSGGIPWKNFIQDFRRLTSQNSYLASHFNRLDEEHQTNPEELYAELGALLGPDIFKTPMGKYYEGILNKPKVQRIPIRRKN